MEAPDSDELLIHNTIQGDTASFGKLVERYQNPVYDLVFRMVGHSEDAGDITQEAFIKAFRSLPGFRYQSSFKTWIFRIASNTCLDHLRRKGRETAKEINCLSASWENALESVPSPAPGPEECLLRNEREETLKKALESLPEIYRLPLLMQLYQKFSYQEIATALCIPEKTVATRLYRAKMMLKDFLLGGETGELPAGEKKPCQFAGRGVHAL